MGLRRVWSTEPDWIVRLAASALAALLISVLWSADGWPQAALVITLLGGGGLYAYVRHTLFHANDLTVARSLDQMMASYVQELDALYARVRGWRHDYHDHLQVLKATLGQGQVASAQAYLATLEDKLHEVDTIVHSGDRLVDAVVNAKLTIAGRLGIPTDVSVFVGERPLRDEVDMVVILGNLLDNAIEAISAQPVGEPRSLRVYITLAKQQLYISVTNSMADAQAIDPAFASTKNDRRGLGLRRINALVAKYNGMINRQYETGVFATEILLPLATITN
ncbi:sensor histidine kinase [Lacticaseibacillus absianus]|uniref:sensor histidine kinase n=1 Tax=Lacticaseibacillus absianus TaxID=2729623 RepID=UPI0015C8F486|nr:ATP-binding protein [Lacticaseibacillus absianus]